jgi:hypothetical protein
LHHSHLFFTRAFSRFSSCHQFDKRKKQETEANEAKKAPRYVERMGIIYISNHGIFICHLFSFEDIANLAQLCTVEIVAGGGKQSFIAVYLQFLESIAEKVADEFRFVL